MTDRVAQIASLIRQLTATELIALRQLLDEEPPTDPGIGVREPRNPIPPHLYGAAVLDLPDEETA